MHSPLLMFRPEIYIPLHVHTAKGSIGDSILKIKDYIKKAKEFGLKFLSVTNHGSMNDCYDFYYSCIEEGIAPILGCEVYETQDRLVQTKKKKGQNSDESAYWHLVLIAVNEIGFKNLLYITTDANLNGFYYKPRTDLSVLKEHGEGIIALSACLGGKIPKILSNIKDDSDEESIQMYYDMAAECVQEYKEIFDEFYLEIQPGDFPEQIWANQLLVNLAEYTDTELVVTNDVHYLEQKDWKAHDVHVKIARKMNIEDKPVYPDTAYYFQNYNTIINSFPYLNKTIVEKAINNTVGIANKVKLNINPHQLHMPTFGVPEGYTEGSYLAEICFKRLNEIINVVRDPIAYTSRLMYELEVIDELGFSGYFLTVRDFVKYAKENNIPVGPGRGSVCGSLAAFLAGITLVDPIKYDLLFERFLSVHRKGSIPDVDLDFSADKREDMFTYAVSKHGLDHCALVSTFGMRKAKASLRDTARVYNIPDEVADEAAKLIPTVYYDEEGEKTTDLSIEESLAIVPRLRELQAEYPDWFDMAMKLEDLPRVTSIHAAGTLVSPVQLLEFVPLIKPNQEGINATALNLTDAEKAGFVKFDFLSLATLSVLANTERDIGKWFDYNTDEFNDEAVWNLIGSKHTMTLFQIGSKTYRERMYRLQPKTIKELAACLALVRGPCISAKDDVKYMEILEGKREIEKIHPLYDSVTADTNGILLYQEQLMKICVNFGFTLEEGYKIMKASAKKKFDVLKSYEEKFMKLSEKKKVSKEIADRIFKMIVDTGLYSFNESHAIAYALLCYHSAYLKVYHPREYMTNYLTNAYLRKEEIQDTVAECRRLGFKFKPLDVNKSDWQFTLENNDIRIGMCAITSFGVQAADEVKEKRPFNSMEDFMERISKNKCRKTGLIPAIFGGLFDCFGDRRDIYREFCSLREEEAVEEIKLQTRETFNINDAYDTIENLTLAASLICNPVNDFEPIGFENLKSGKAFTTKAIVRRAKKFKDKNEKQMAFLTLETADGYIDCTMFSDVYAKYKSYCKKNLICTLRGKKDREDSCIVVGFE